MKNKEELLKEIEALQEQIAKFKRLADEDKKKIKRLKESTDRHKDLVQTIPDIIYELDTDGKFTFISDGIKQLGYDPKELIGKHFKEILHPDDFKDVSRSAVLSKYKGKVTGDEAAPKLFDEKRTGERMTKDLGVRLRLKKQKVVSIDYCYGELHSSGKWGKSTTEKDKKLVGSIGVVRDFTRHKQAKEELEKHSEQLEKLVEERTAELKKAHEQLLRTQKLESIGLLAGSIAHDFNNILSIILGNVNLAMTEAAPEDKLTQRLAAAEKAVWRATDLTKRLLTFSRGGEPIKKPVSMAKLLKGSANLALQDSNVVCQYSMADDLWQAEIDEGQIDQVIDHLIINAAQAMPSGGTIKIGAFNITTSKETGLPVEEGEYVKITISDQGVGISCENLSKIFDPFFTTKQKGSGLGLATCYSIIKKHKGYIDVESKLGEGTIFTILLPARAAEGEELREKAGERTKREARILLMDDEEDILKTTGEVLRSLGYEVELARDGAEAIDLYKKAKEAKRPFDVLILDLTIHEGMGGKETVSKLKEIDSGAKAIAFSGYSNDPVMADPKRYGFCDVVIKPYKIEEMNRVLQEIVRKEIF